MRRLVAATIATVAMILGPATPATSGSSTTPEGLVSAEDVIAPMSASLCGSSYQWVSNYKIPRTGTTLAEMNVYWSSSAKRNCLVVNHAGPTYGVSLYTEAKIRPSGSSWPRCPSSTGCDGGFYRYYAGPVKTPSGVNMSGRCIDISGVIDWVPPRVVKRVHCG